MNPPDLESILRAAPRPVPPAGLQQKLNRHVRLEAPIARESNHVPSSSWLKRWWPTFVFGGGIVACAAALVTQKSALRNARALAASPAGSAVISKALSESAALVEVAPGQDRRAEMGRLRAELTQLQALTDSIRQLAAENQQLQRALAEAEAALPGISPEDLEEAKAAQERALSIQCVNNLKQVGLALRVWASSHRDTFPSTFLSMTNELGSPKVLICPADTAHPPAVDWASSSSANVSYEFLAAGGTEGEPTRVATRCLIHGNIGLCDGSVQMSRGDGSNLKTHLVTREGKLFFE